MSYFTYASSIWSNVTDMVTTAAETVGNYITPGEDEGVATVTQSIKEVQNSASNSSSVFEEQKKTQQDQNVVQKVFMLQSEVKEPEEEKDDMEEYDMVTDSNLYVVLYEHECGITTEENVFIDLEESTKYH